MSGARLSLLGLNRNKKPLLLLRAALLTHHKTHIYLLHPYYTTSKARAPARLVVLEGSILQVFILEVGVLAHAEALRCGACHPEFLYVTATERRLKETKQRVLRPQIFPHLFAPVVQDACQVLDLAGVGLRPETIAIPGLCQMLAQVIAAIHMESERIVLLSYGHYLIHTAAHRHIREGHGVPWQW